MKLRIFSDLHLEHWVACQRIPVGTGDILVLAGDIMCAKHFKTNGYIHSNYEWFLNECSQNYSHVLYVLGNHEFYGYNYEGTFNKIRKNLPNNFYLLNDESITINEWNFIGFTLWADFRNENPLEMMEAHSYMNDYKSIRIGSNYRKLNPNDTLAFHNASKNYLLSQLKNFNENVFVISHHAPSYQSIANEFKTSFHNGAYCSDLDSLILEHPQIKYWVHGHTHTTFDYNIGDCRVLCNPGGYPGQDTGFNSELEIAF